MIKIPIDPTNPGHVFAAIGLTELAFRLTGEATGHFDHLTYKIALGKNWDIATLISEIQNLEIHSEDPTNNDAPLHLGSLKLDWWLRSTAKDPKYGNLKTWSGTVTLPKALNAAHHSLSRTPELLYDRALAYLPGKKNSTALTSFDAQRGRSTLDTGFSPNKLNLKIVSAPSVEFLSIVGLQRAWPTKKDGRYAYYTWDTPLTPSLLPVAIIGQTSLLAGYSFSVIKDGDYSRLQSAQPITRN